MSTIRHQLGIADYGVVSASLAISAFVGIVFRFSGDRQKTTNEYLLAGKNTRMLPVVLSTSVTGISGIAMLGMSAEIYKYGITFAIMLIPLAIGMLLSCYLVIPVYYRCGVSSIYEYLQMRFGKYTRKTISAMFLIQMFLYMSIVLFAPALALSAVTDMSMEMAIIVCGTVCTIYCFLGGLKAVMWSDVFQSTLMLACIIAIMGTGIYEVGGLREIFKRARSTNRLDVSTFGFDLTTRYTFWNCVFCGLQYGFGFFGTNQIHVQRLLSMSEPKRAQKALLLSVIPVTGLYALVFFIGLVLYSVFYLCDPMQDTEAGISSYDQLVPYFIITRLGSVPGLTGLCIAGIFSGSLSTMSSALNSMSTVAVIDFVRPHFKATDKTMVAIAKGLSLFFGIATTFLTFAIASVKSISQAFAVFVNVFEGPIIAIFSIGFFTRKVSDKSAVLGLIVSAIVCNWIGIGSMFSGHMTPVYPLETSGCSSFSNVSAVISNSTTKTIQSGNKDVFVLYKLAYFWIPTFGCILALCLTFFLSILIDKNKDMVSSDSKLLSPITQYWIKTSSNTLELKPDEKHTTEKNIF